MTVGTTDRVAGIGLLAIAGWVAFETRALPLGTTHGPGPGYVPLLLAIALAAFAAALVLRGGGPSVARIDWAEARHAGAILGACVFTAVAVDRLGYRITMILFLLFLYGVVQRRGRLAAVALALALALGSHWLFDAALKVPLPRGPLGL